MAKSCSRRKGEKNYSEIQKNTKKEMYELNNNICCKCGLFVFLNLKDN